MIKFSLFFSWKTMVGVFMMICMPSLVVNADCISLEDLFKESLWALPIHDQYVTINNSTVSFNYLAGNPFRIGSINGTQIAEAFGECIPLEVGGDDTEVYSYCYGEFIVDGNEEDTINWAGLNLQTSTDTSAIVAIVGGTGCYDGVQGTLRRQSVSIDVEPFQAGVWDLLKRPNFTTCSTFSEQFNGRPIFNVLGSPVMIDSSSEFPQRLMVWSNEEIYSGSVEIEISGESFGFCQLPSTDLALSKFIFCRIIFKFNNDDLGDFVTTSGLVPTGTDPSRTMIINSGTGCYEGESGSLHVDLVDDTHVKWTYVDPDVNATCNKSLSQTFSGSLLEPNINTNCNAIPNATGDQCIWESNPLKDNNDNVVGTTSGVCTVLPGVTAGQCSAVLVFDDLGSISAQGIAPFESNADIYAITGGTGCFQGVYGTIHVMNINNAFETFKWELISVTEPNHNQGSQGHGDINGNENSEWTDGTNGYESQQTNGAEMGGNNSGAHVAVCFTWLYLGSIFSTVSVLFFGP